MQRISFHFCCTGEKVDFVEYGVGKPEVVFVKRESLRIHRYVALKKNLSISSASVKVYQDSADLPPGVVGVQEISMDTNIIDANSSRHDGRHAGSFIENGVGFPRLWC